VSGSATRRTLLAGAGVLAAVGGALWYDRRSNAPDTLARLAESAETVDLWSLRFPRPAGGELVMAELRGQPLLINFWATWCPPCIKELPEFDRFARSHDKQLRVVGLAIDSLVPVQEFLKKQPLGFAVGLAGLAGTDLARSMGNSAGALPFTVLLDAKGAVVQRKLGETQHAELEAWARQL
jgi:thiol-disulfide isomerase/thioredoxin